MKSLSHVWLFATPWTVAYQAPSSMGFSRQEYWSGLPFPSPGDLPDPGIEPGSPAFQADALTSEPPGKPIWKKKKMWGDTDSKGLSFFSLWLRRPLGFPGGTSGKESACQCRRHGRRRFNPWARKTPWRRKWQPAPVFLLGKSHGQRSLVGHSPQRHKGSRDWAHTQKTCPEGKITPAEF